MHEDVRHQGDPRRFRRFFVFLNLFIAAMMILVSANNFLMLFVGWEGVGLCSYLLIGFWFEKGAGGIGNALAAKKAFVVNRVGDFGLLLGILGFYWATGQLEFTGIADRVAELMAGGALPVWVATGFGILVFLGPVAKSAQVPLNVWLPDAMEGPTPI
jgi:NADH:ubiquinone oxidoreductase subunit 5 (subunit L)/multisubunit Na+/H+ antiporter MnhA subunit